MHIVATPRSPRANSAQIAPVNTLLDYLPYGLGRKWLRISASLIIGTKYYGNLASST
jgi:hypothetical protein